jgi:hypothetical protein
MDVHNQLLALLDDWKVEGVEKVSGWYLKRIGDNGWMGEE